MKRNELIELRELVSNEIKRRERIKELLKNNLIQEYLRITNTKFEELDDSNIKEILEHILPTFTITKTNGIYVCTGAYYIDCDICYEETNYYTRNVDINSSNAKFRIYTDIENNKWQKAVRDKEDKIRYNYPFFNEFELNNIVLNPYNTNNDGNGYQEVRLEFFENALEYGQTKSKRKILEKYSRLH